MKKTINIDFDNSSSVILGYDPNILGPASTKFAYSTHIHGSVHFDLTNISATATSVSNGLTLALSVASLAGGANNVLYAGDNITLSTTGVSTTASVYGLADITHNHGGMPFITGNIGGTIGSDNWSLSIPDFLLTAAESDHTHSIYAGTNTSSNSITGSNVKITLNTDGLALGIPNYLTTAAISNHTHGVPTGYNITIGSSSNALVLSVANKMGTNTSSATVTGDTFGMTGNTSGLTLAIPDYATNANNLSLDGNTSGTLTLMSSGTVTIAGGNNITLSQAGNAFTVIGQEFMASDAGSNFIGTNTSIVNTSISMTANSEGITLDAPNYITTAMVSDAGSNFVGLNSSIEGGSMTMNSSGITISIPSNTATATAANAVHAGDWISLSTAGADTTVGVTGLQATSATSAITSNAVNTSVLTDLQYTSVTSAITASAMNTSERNNYFYASLATGLTNLTGTINSTAISLSGPGIGSVAFINSNGVTFGTSVDGVTTSVSASVNTVGGSGGGVAIADAASTLTTGTAVFSNANGVSFGMNGSTITASYGSNSFLLTAYSSLLQATSDNSLSMALSQSTNLLATSASSLLQAVSNNSQSLGTSYTTHTHGSIYTASATGTNITNSSAFSGLTLGIPPYAASSHTHSNLYIALSASSAYQTSVLSNTFALTNHTHSSAIGSVYFLNDTSVNQNITWGSSTSGSSTSIFATGGGGTGAGTGGVAIRGSGTSVQSTGTVQFINTNGLSFELTNGSMRGSVVHGDMYFSDGSYHTWGSSTSGISTTIQLSINISSGSAGGVAIQGSGSYIHSTGTVAFANSNGLTFGLSNNGYMTGSHNAYSASSQLSGVFLERASSTRFAGVNTSTVSRTGSQLGMAINSSGATLSVPNWLTAASAGIAGLGNTATIPFTSGSVRISGVNLTVNTSSSGASQYLQISAPAIGYLFFSNTNGHSWSSSVAGMSTSIYIIT